jgi:TPR repeat protein
MLAQTGAFRSLSTAFTFFYVSLLFAPLSSSAPRPPQTTKSVLSISDLRLRAESGDLAASSQLSSFLLAADPSSEGYDLALDWLRSLVASHEADAQFVLGYLYQKGHGVPQDYTRAAENYQTAAHQGHAIAENNLAGFYQDGLGVPKDLPKAIELYRAAADKGNRVARFNLASLYSDGTGVPRNLSLAAKWFRASAELGYAPAQHNLAILYFTGRGVSIDYYQAAYWDALAAEQGEARAQTDLGYLYETGRGVPLDYVTAYAWYKRAMAAGEKSGAERLKSLSRIMTRKQRDQAITLAAMPLSPPTTAFADTTATDNSTTAPGN